jgi:hypothetical protein
MRIITAWSNGRARFVHEADAQGAGISVFPHQDGGQVPSLASWWRTLSALCSVHRKHGKPYNIEQRIEDSRETS